MTVPTRLAAALAGRYRIERELGAGGMATVYLAHDERHDRSVAMKVLHEDLGATLGPERFLAEIKTTAKLQHPHILPLLDSGNVDGLLYYVMPYVEGESLRDRLDREKQLPIDDAVRVAREIADALGAAHAQGIVHRDIKPENILLQGGHAMVADFGIALAVQSAGGGRLTQTGLSLGTPQYMAPEQAMGEKSVDARADIYALGAVTYEMLVGEPPFTGATVQAIVAKVLSSDPEPPTTMRKTIPPHVEETVLHALAKLPADRPATAAAFASGLGATGAMRVPKSSSRALPSATGQKRAWAVAGVSLGVFAGFALAWVALRGGAAAAGGSGVSRSYLLQPKSEALPGGTVDFVISPNGEDFIYVGPGEKPGTVQLWRKRRGDLHAERIAGTDGANSPFMSPDGKWVAFKVADKLLKVALSGGPPVTLASGLSIIPQRGAWVDDRRIVAGGGSTTYMVPADGGKAEPFVESSLFAGYNPQLITPLPGGKGALIMTCPLNCSRSTVYAVELATKKSRQLLPDARSPVYLPSGHLAYITASGAVMVVPFDAATMQIHGDARPVLERVGSHLSISSNGTLVYREGEQGVASRPIWIDRAGRATPADTLPVSQISSFSLSPDGKSIAISVVNNGTQDIWVRDLQRGQYRVTSDPGAHFRAVWSPDAKHLYYVHGDTTFEYLERNANGQGEPHRVPTGGRSVVEGKISRDGSWLVMRTGGQGIKYEILALRLGVDTVAQALKIGPGTLLGLSLSPDAKYIAYTGYLSEQGEVWVSPFPDMSSARWQVSVKGGTQPYWSNDGKEIFYLGPSGEIIAAQVTTAGGFAVKSQARLFDASEYLRDTGFHLFWQSPDGQRFMMLRPESFPGDLVVVDNWFREIREKLAAK